MISYLYTPFLTLIVFIFISIFLPALSIAHSPEMTLPDTKNHCLDKTFSDIDREALNMKIQETIRTRTKEATKEEIKEEIPKGSNKIPIFTHANPHSPKIALPNPNVDYVDIIPDTADHKAIEEEIKQEIKETTKEEVEETTEKATKKTAKRKIDQVVDDEGSTDVNLVTPVPSNIVNLPVDQSWNSFEEAFEATLDFVHCQGYGARTNRLYRFSDASERKLKKPGNMPEYVRLGCDLVEMKKCDQVNEDFKRKHINCRKISTCSFGVIVMKCLSCWRIVNILSARHNHEPLPSSSLPSQHRLERKRKETWIYQMIQKGFYNYEIISQVQMRDPTSCLDRSDVEYLRRSAKRKHESELQILPKSATDDVIPENGPLSPDILKKEHRLQRKMKKAYIIQQAQQGLSNEVIVQQMRRQDPNSCLDRQDITSVRDYQKRNQINALRRRNLKSASNDDPTENHQLSEEGPDDDLAEDHKLLIVEMSEKKHCTLPKKEVDDDLEKICKLSKKELDNEKDCKFQKRRK